MVKQAEDPGEIALAPALVEFVHRERGRMTGAQRVEGFRRLVMRGGTSRDWRFGTGRFGNLGFGNLRWVALPVAVGALAFGGVMLERNRSAGLSYAVDGGRVEASGLVEAAYAAAEPRLRFSDGSEVMISAGTQAFVRTVDAHGARVSVTGGSAHVDVAHVPGAHWLFDAGPFLVTVTGTAFTVAWKPEDEQLDVRMERGTVGVSGPLFDGALPLRSGQHLIVRVRQRETLVRDIGDDAVAEAPAAAQGPAPAVTAAVSPATSPGKAGAKASVRASEPSTHRGWEAKVAAGEFEAVLQEAEQSGLDACLAAATHGDLAALADAARYARRGDVARRALLAERRRFPFSASAHDASFLLGRLEETEQNDVRAIAWYDTYLAENPGGTYASEALGRKMELAFRLYGSERAREIATEYVNRFPQGTYAARAHVLDRSP